jgi:hypothetical protein
VAYGIVHRFAGGTQEQYENSLKAVHPDEGASLPEGQTFHIGGATEDGGWIVIALFEDKGSWERFRDEALLPGLQKVPDGLQGLPEETGFEVRKQQSA